MKKKAKTIMPKRKKNLTAATKKPIVFIKKSTVYSLVPSVPLKIKINLMKAYLKRVKSASKTGGKILSVQTMAKGINAVWKRIMQRKKPNIAEIARKLKINPTSLRTLCTETEIFSSPEYKTTAKKPIALNLKSIKKKSKQLNKLIKKLKITNRAHFAYELKGMPSSLIDDIYSIYFLQAMNKQTKIPAELIIQKTKNLWNPKITSKKFIFELEKALGLKKRNSKTKTNYLFHKRAKKIIDTIKRTEAR